MPGGNTRSTLFVPPHPAYARRATGCRITDADGLTVIDAQNNFTALIHGHAFPPVSRAIIRALGRGMVSVGMPTQSEVELAELLSRRVSPGMHWRFANSGTEAIMYAIRLARAVTGRAKVITFAGSYHGGYDAVMSTSRGVNASVASETIVVPFNDSGTFRRLMAEHGRDLAAVVFDGMPNRAGLVPATEEFRATVQVLTGAAGALLLVDEVLTFRCGTGGLHARLGVNPDLLALGKIIGGGLPIGAVGGRPELMAMFDPRTTSPIEHSGTFTGNPLSMHAGLAALRAFTASDVARLERLGDELRTELRALGWRVTGLASLFRIHVDDSPRLWRYAYQRGLLLAKNGLGCLSTAMKTSDVEQIARVLAVKPREL